MRLLVALFGIVLAGRAMAHDQWADGRPIPAWVKQACCGPADAHWLQASQLHRVDGGWLVDGFPGVFPDDKVLPSEDGEIWGFWRVWDGGDIPPSAYCLFMPMSF